MIAIPDLTGPEKDALYAVINGSSDYFATRVRVNGRMLTVMVALEGASPSAPLEPTSEPEYDHSSRIKPGWPGSRPARTPVVSGVVGTEGPELSVNETTDHLVYDTEAS